MRVISLTRCGSLQRLYNRRMSTLATRRCNSATDKLLDLTPRPRHPPQGHADTGRELAVRYQAINQRPRKPGLADDFSNWQHLFVLHVLSPALRFVDAAISGVEHTLGTYLLHCKLRFFSLATSVFIHIDRALTRSFHRHTAFRNKTPIRKTRCAVCQRKWQHEIFFRVRGRDAENWTN
jgi:hypothetical protein